MCRSTRYHFSWALAFLKCLIHGKWSISILVSVPTSSRSRARDQPHTCWIEIGSWLNQGCSNGRRYSCRGKLPLVDVDWWNLCSFHARTVWLSSRSRGYSFHSSHRHRTSWHLCQSLKTDLVDLFYKILSRWKILPVSALNSMRHCPWLNSLLNFLFIQEHLSYI